MKFRNLWKFALSALLLGYVLWNAKLGEMTDRLAELQFHWFGLGLVFFIGALFLMTARWHVLLREAPTCPSYWGLMVIYLYGIYFNLFLPGSVGGDVIRGLELAPRIQSKTLSALTILTERVVGLGALGLVVVASGLGYLMKERPVALTAVVLGLGTLGLAATLLMFRHRATVVSLRRFERPLSWLLRFVGNSNHQDQLLASLRKATVSIRAVGIAFVLSLAIRIIWLIGSFLLAMALQLDPPFWYVFVTLPLVELVRMIPIAFNGVGTREAAFVYFFSPTYLTFSEAVVWALLVYSFPAIFGLIGGVLYSAKKHWPLGVPTPSVQAK